MLLTGVILYSSAALWTLLSPKTKTVLAAEATLETFAAQRGIILHGQDPQQALTLPPSALEYAADGTVAVYIVHGGQARRREVTVLAETEDTALVTSPTLTAGDAVLVDADEVYEGMPT